MLINLWLSEGGQGPSQYNFITEDLVIALTAAESVDLKAKPRHLLLPRLRTLYLYNGFPLERTLVDELAASRNCSNPPFAWFVAKVSGHRGMLCAFGDRLM